VKKCPECGNPSYDGAPVCGNCGYNFPKPKVKARKKSSIFESEQRSAPRSESIISGDSKVDTSKNKKTEKKPSNEQSTLDIIKEKKLIIGIILLITLIVICGIVLTGSNNNSTQNSGDLLEYSASDFAFKYPESWKKVNLSDDEHEGAIFFEDDNNTVIEYYNITSDASSLQEVNQERISNAINGGDMVELLDKITINGNDASNFIVENSGGNYTRYVSMLSDGKLHVFKVTGEPVDSIKSNGIETVINSAKII
jgi:hypothetical protein